MFHAWKRPLFKQSTVGCPHWAELCVCASETYAGDRVGINKRGDSMLIIIIFK